jgi:hypothetical protein
MQLAEAAELETFLQRTFTAAEESAAILLLEGATAEIEAEVGRTFSTTTHSDVLSGTWSVDLVLPQRPVTAVTSVTLNGLAVATGAWEWNDLALIRRGITIANGFDSDLESDWNEYGWQGGGWRSGLHWGGPASSIAVVYTAGYATIPADLRFLCLQVAARTFLNPSQIRSEQLGAYAVTYTIPGTGEPFGVMLTEVERRTLRRRYGHTSSTVIPVTV